MGGHTVTRDRALREHLIYLLGGNGAHVTFDQAVADLPQKLQGKRTPGVPHTLWQLVEHLRIAQWDIAGMKKLVKDPASDLFAPLPHGDGQTLLREVLLAADHNAYHIGEIVILRRSLGAWKGAR